MLPTEPAGPAQSILEFAIHLEHFLDEANPGAQHLPDLSSYLTVLPLRRKDLSPELRIDFDRAAVTLWNKCCSLDGSDESQWMRGDLAKVRAFSYFLLESAGSIKRKNHARLFKIAIKASKSCLDAGLLDIASAIIEQLASKQERLAKSDDNDAPSGGGFTESLQARYLLLRVALVWRQNRLDLAEHFYINQLEQLRPNLSPEQIEELADLCYEIGVDQLNQKQAGSAAKWLRRGCKMLTEHSSQMSQVDIAELRLSLMHSHVRALLASDDLEDRDEAMEALKALCQVSNSPCLPIEWPELIEPGVSSQACRNPASVGGIRKRPNRKSSRLSVRVLHYLHHLKRLSVASAISVLDVYIVTRLAPDGEKEWTEGTIITLIWLMTSDGTDGIQPKLPDFAESFDRIFQAWGTVLSAEATRGVLVVGASHVP
ncbi:hypothetical protein CLCR_04716 [Cladophialophora carrionii]|uniref:Protein ZIP4 homolog n=1 Tax=Cladophialophora carrionii TaxID=86049 RepID=A0A1C1CJT9_9EURO|nr:hypothetical protein CLCR_04716 [Cladophialophora carrionii]